MPEIIKKAELTFPEIGLIAGTRGILGAGIGLLLASKLANTKRRSIGWTLFLLGAISTIPIVRNVVLKNQTQDTTP